MEIVLGNQRIRDWNINDAPSISGYANNRKIWLNLRDGFPHPYILDDALRFIRSALLMKPVTYFAIATEKEAIGAIGLTIGKDVHRYSAELGYWLGEPFWGKGIMSRALSSFTPFAFKAFNLNRIYAEPYTTNPASARVLEKAGFVREGMLKANVFKDGKILDQYMYSYVPERL